MSKAIFSRAKASATRALKRYGTKMAIETRDNNTISGYGIMYASETDENGETIDTNQRTIMFQGGLTAPAPGDSITINKVAWGVVSVTDYNPDGALNIAYRLRVSQ